MKQEVRVLLVDDEPLSRRRLAKLLLGRPEIAALDEARNGREAIEAIRRLRPDLVFLDIQMPDLDGFGVLEAIGPGHMPMVVFVTAFDEYALDAFAIAALDYLLKPFADERFEQTFERALEALRQRRSTQLCERLACLVEGWNQHRGRATPAGSERPLRRIPVERRGRVYLVPVAEIEWIEAAGAYVRLHSTESGSGRREHLVRDSLKRLEAVLDPERFVRIHRSAMVQVDRVRELRPLFHGEYEVVLASGAVVKLSRGYRDRLDRLLS